MIRTFFNLQMFAEESAAGAGGNGSPNTGTATSTNTGYSFEQAEEIANARAERAEKAALSSFFKQQGMTEAEINAALADFKTKKAASAPDVTKLQNDLAAANAKIAEQNNKSYLTGKNVKADDVDYVMFKISQQVNDKVTFEQATDKFLKENPKYAGQGTYRVSTSTQTGTGSGTQTANEQINAMIRGHFNK